MNAKLLGVHVLVRENSYLLPRCLASVQAVADEIIVMDTGLLKETGRIATGFGARVHLFPWPDDSAAIRNAGLSLSGTAWALVLDADEMLLHTGAKRRLDWLADTSDTAFRVQIEHVMGAGRGHRIYSSGVRLFRAASGFRYEGIMYERLTAPPGDRQAAEALEQARLCPLTLVSGGR
ncbi:glycosyltransferase [Paenibacillus sp. y28]|uniref:glycosyltransferase n=1 Tax=Paenibacillus sp. y28 TaxID=3129110 RepID=UPI0030177B54